jgi:hypothetical protein
MKKFLEKMFQNTRIRLRDVWYVKAAKLHRYYQLGYIKIALPSIQREGIEDVQARVKFDDNSTCPGDGK